MTTVSPTQNRHSRPGEPASGLRIHLLGPVSIALDGVSVALASRKARALLGYLALRPGAEIPRSVLAGLLWGDRSEVQARASLRQSLAELRAALTGATEHPLRATKDFVEWRSGSAWVDAQALEAAAASEDGETPGAAVDLYAGELMEGLSIGESSFEQWLAAERERFRHLVCGLLKRLLDSADRRGQFDQALTHGAKLLSLDPLQEDVHRTLMRLYAAQGRADAALAQYERCRRELAEQLGVRPDAATEALAAELRASRRRGGSKERASPDRADRDRVVPPALRDRPSIAVLPFTAIGGETDSAYFAEGVADDIITEMSRNRDLFVVARQSSFHIAGQESDPANIGRALGVRHLLAGSVRRAGDRLRLSVHLLACETGSEVWSERYDRKLEDLFAVQLDIARTVTATLVGRLAALAGQEASTKAPGNFAAYDHVLRAQQFLERYTRADYAKAREHLEAAILADPSYARPYGLLCLAGVYGWFWDVSDDGLAEVVKTGEKALALDDQDAKAHLALAVAQLFSWNHDRAIHHIERARALNPNDDLVLVEHGRLLAGIEPEAGLLLVREAMRLNPFHPNWYWNIEGICLHIGGRYEEAIAPFQRIDTPQFWIEAYLAACHAMCDRPDRASEHLARLHDMRPDFRLEPFRISYPIRDDVLRARFFDSLRRAGIKD